MLNIKLQLYHLCQGYVSQRIDAAKQALSAMQQDANEETKSVAGDKYETGRAMIQLEIEKLNIQLQEFLRLYDTLSKINVNLGYSIAQSGSLVITNQGNFFLSVSAGQFNIDGKNYISISPSSPIGSRLMGLKTNDSFAFNNKNYEVEAVW